MPKSRSFTSPVRRHEDVGRLEVAVDDQGAMGVLDGVAHDAKEGEARLEGQLLAPTPIGDGDAVHELHHEVRRAVGGQPAIEQARDVGMLERGQHLALGAEASDDAAVAGAAPHELDRDLELVLAVGRARRRRGGPCRRARSPGSGARAPGTDRARDRIPGARGRGGGRRPRTVRWKGRDPLRRPPTWPRSPRATRRRPRRRGRGSRRALRRAARAPARRAPPGGPRFYPSAAAHSATDLLSQPGSGRRPAPLHGLGGQVEHAGRFLEGQPSEDAALHHALRSLVELPQPIEGGVDGEHLLHFERREQRAAPRPRRGTPACGRHRASGACAPARDRPGSGAWSFRRWPGNRPDRPPSTGAAGGGGGRPRGRGRWRTACGRPIRGGVAGGRARAARRRAGAPAARPRADRRRAIRPDNA